MTDRIVSSSLMLTASFFLANLLTASHVYSDDYDVVVYGGTSAAITSAVQVKKMGGSVVVVSPDIHLGGLSSGGLGWTDTGNKAVIGGLAREFYHRVWKKYQEPDNWKWQPRESYGNQGQGTAAIDGAQRTMWIFEPHIAEEVFDDFVNDYDIPVIRDEWLDREDGVTVVDGKIQSIRTLSGKTYSGRMFIDATYEGDLLAAAGVDYHVGRESNDTYGEQWNGIQVGVFHHGHWFRDPVDPYVVPGDPGSGLLPRISSEPPEKKGEGDHRVQAYCYRMCLTNHDENRVPFPKPDGYDPAQYELLLRVFETGWREGFNKFDPIPNYKTDTNNHGPFSTDNIGYNYDYPEATYERRKEILREHEQYQKGLMYFVANDPRVPEDVRTKMSKWGLAKDEFTDNGNWPHQIYVREARRLIGEYVMTEHNCFGTKETIDPVGMGSYTLDSHNVQRYVTDEGFVQNEGDLGVRTPPYQISYRSLVPKKAQCTNLLVPVCVSSSHIAFGSIRMEPVFMILGQSAATAGMLAIQDDLAVQDVPYSTLSRRLLDDGQVLEYDSPRTGNFKRFNKKDFAGIVVDIEEAGIPNGWVISASTTGFLGNNYLHDGNQKDRDREITFDVPIKDSGKYAVAVSYTPHSNRATNVPVTIKTTDGQETVLVNQRKQPAKDSIFHTLGTYQFDAPTATIQIGTKNTDGHVIVDAVQLIPVE
ncbi:Xanthan lyase precursor [Thalassoglobus neptunius]|uniref:Xanthan lyase n=1 Tax=Thalassoglobus neptunius TaxID=1938619 RepID=A0A5C5WN62_9PLAN|nr:FAD-dependent oxidoreductase [Thalassoglobus neptunius]TWT52276.1 Xanthan lyase precursor [Thalassoglobus neptunius]